MKGDDLSTRLRRFGANVVRLCRELPDDAGSKHIVRQLVRAGTGGGSNYEEARGSESRADFVHKLSIASKELREALYWLRLLQDVGGTATQLNDLVMEADELVAILTSSVKTAKHRAELSQPVGKQSWRTRDGGGPDSCYLYAPTE